MNSFLDTKNTMQASSHLLVFVMFFVLCNTETSYIRNATLPVFNCGENAKTLALLGMSIKSINRAKHLYPDCLEDELNCRKKEKSLAYLDVALDVISEVTRNYPTCSNDEILKNVKRPIDCSDVLRSGHNKSGVYTIWPRSNFFPIKSLDVYCDMDTDGGGWTVIQRRGQFSTPHDYFYKDWNSYKKGFGNITEEFWLGLDNIHSLSNQASYSIRFDLKDADNERGYAFYDAFWIGNEDTNYTLHIDGYSGNVGDSMRTDNNVKFSTKDRDNDHNPDGACAGLRQGAWWYSACSLSNLNGLNQPGRNSKPGVVWSSWKDYRALSEVEIKVKRLNCRSSSR